MSISPSAATRSESIDFKLPENPRIFSLDSPINTSKAKEVPGPALGEINVTFEIVPSRSNNFDKYEEVRRQVQTTGPEPILIIYDVSPGGTSQSLADQLKKYSRIVVFDHHGGAAPAIEVRGKEKTAAEVTVDCLSRMWSAGVLKSTDGQAVPLIAATHSMNVDPDAIIAGFLIESFANPERRDFAWSEQNRELLIKAARFGDISLFGGIDILNLRPETMTDEMKVAFTILDLINREKEALVIENKLSEVAAELNLAKAAIRIFETDGHQYKTLLETRAALEETIASQATGTSSWQVSPGATLVQTRENLLEEILGNEKITSKSLLEIDPHELRDTVFQTLSRTQIREVFLGKINDDIYSQKHPSCWTEANINRLLKNIRNQMPRILSRLSDFEENYCAFGEGLKQVHLMARKCSQVICPMDHPENRITVTKANGRIDYENGVPQKRQRYPVYDWLKEAGASYADPVLHIMNRYGALTIAARAPQPQESMPFVNLSNAGFVAELLAIEAERAKEAGRQPANFLIKANLVLPLGAHSIKFEDVTKLLFKYYDELVIPFESGLMPADPVMHTVNYGDVEGPFDGIWHFLHTAQAAEL